MFDFLSYYLKYVGCKLLAPRLVVFSHNVSMVLYCCDDICESPDNPSLFQLQH
jgi:hypothetical protein